MSENCRVNDCQKRLLEADRDALIFALRDIVKHSLDPYAVDVAKRILAAVGGARE